MSSVRVVARFRPLNSKEVARGDDDVWTYLDEQTVAVTTSEGKELKFDFDRIFPPNSSQEEVFDFCAKPICEDIFNGYNGTLFVYGQTGSGKTHTMSGPDLDDPVLRGVIPRMNDQVFDTVMSANERDEFLMYGSYVEIYMEKLRDLLFPKEKGDLAVRENKEKGVYIEGCTDAPIGSPEDVLEIIRAGNANRMTAATNMNAHSSRSHSLFILTIQRRDTQDNSLKTGRLYLVDLAGSEKVGKTGASGQTLEEAKQINKSLSALGNVINALTDSKAKHIPYRDSKLTRVLQESLGGNAKTTLIVNCSPAGYNEQESVSTLRFGTRAKKIVNQAKVNAIRSAKELEAELEKAYKEIERLKRSNDRLEDEIAVLQGLDPDERRRAAAKASESGASASAFSGFADGELSQRYVSLEEKLRLAEERVAELEDENESFRDQMNEKDDQLMEVESLRSQLLQAGERVSATASENEELVLRVAKLTVDNEAARYKIDELEAGAGVTSLSRAANAQWEAERAEFEREIKRLKFEAGEDEAEVKAAPETAKPAQPAAPAQDTFDDTFDHSDSFGGGDGDESAGWSWDSSKVDESLSENATPAPSISKGEQTEAELLANNKGKGRRELLSLVAQQQKDVERLRREKTMQQQTIDEMIAEAAARAQSGGSGPTSGSASNGDFEQLRGVLLRDLENRSQKIVELEMILEEAREQYVVLLEQIRPVGTDNIRTLQAKVAALQKAASFANEGQQRYLSENVQLRLDNEVYAKQLISRNERIHGLEQLLHESEAHLADTAKRLENAQTQPGNRPRVGTNNYLRTSVGGTQGQGASVTGGRVARPLRGGGGQPKISAASPGDSASASAVGPSASASGSAASASTSASGPASASATASGKSEVASSQTIRGGARPETVVVPSPTAGLSDSPPEAGRELVNKGPSAQGDKKKSSSVWDMFKGKS